MSDEADDDPQLKSLRAVWLSMPDEDPPERGLAELMAAARVKAEKMTQPSLWQRIKALMLRPPMLALATVLVLIGGAVFLGQRRDKLAHEPTSEGTPTFFFPLETRIVTMLPFGWREPASGSWSKT